ncbi:MAG TPA: DUF4878 domain-containing protein [Lacibacter sp.]|nr:DUF4878 domain-containing protein [Lacibacter sp.]HMO87605.1 DUF4878 domain-containing protein [Lacibacter sp.]HMP87313.1 DUF4878 domain-containing protein [Lacibacter sp.]
MKKFVLPLISIFLPALLLTSCSGERQRPDDALGTAREFVRSSLDGDYKWARELLYQDSVNLVELEMIERRYDDEMSKADKDGYKKSSILIHSVENVNDTVVIVNYSNSWKKKQMPLKVIKKDGKWQVDLDYTFSGNL